MVAGHAQGPVYAADGAAEALLLRRQTSHGRPSPATAPRLPDADQADASANLANREISQFLYKERPHMPGSSTTPGRPGAHASAPVRVAFRGGDCVGTRNCINLSRLNGWPMCSPVNASSAPSRVPTHDSGPIWIVTPLSRRTFTTYSLPVSWRSPTDCSALLTNDDEDR